MRLDFNMHAADNMINKDTPATIHGVLIGFALAPEESTLVVSTQNDPLKCTVLRPSDPAWWYSTPSWSQMTLLLFPGAGLRFCFPNLHAAHFGSLVILQAAVWR